MLSLENRRNRSQLDNAYPSPTSSYSDEESVCVCIHRVTEGWVRCWNSVASTHYWKNKNTQEITYDNPFFFKNDNEIPYEMRNQWFVVFDEHMQKPYYVNCSLHKEQWQNPSTENDSNQTSTNTVARAYYLEEYAKEHFNVKGSFFHNYSLESLLTYNKKELYRPLLLMESSLSKIALLINHEIHQYIGHTKTDHIQRITAYLLLSPIIIVDECYCQLFKQLTKCPSQVIERKVIDILIVVCSSFLPSTSFLPYVEYYLQSHLNSNQKLIQLCYSYFLQCKNAKTRKELPTLSEIDLLLKNEKLCVDIHLVSNKMIQLYLSPISIVKDVNSMIAEQLHLQTDQRLFQLFLVDKQDEYPLSEEMRVIDILSQMNDSMILQYEVAYYLPFNLYNQNTLELVYYQAIHDIHIGKYFHKEEDFYNTIALIIQQQLQDYVGDNRLLCNEIEQLLPPFLSIPSKRLVSEAEIIRIYSRLKGYSQQECKVSLLEYMNDWKDYGVTHFYCDQILPNKKEQQMIGVSPRGLHVGDYQDRFEGNAYTEFFPYSSISAWGISSSSFSFYLKTKTTQIHYSFKVHSAKNLFHLIKVYTSCNCLLYLLF